jgi:cytochrome c
MRSPAAWIVSAVSLGSLALMVFAPHTRVEAQENPKSPEFYTAKVKPIFEANCYKCHGGEFHRGGLSLATKAGMLKGGADGPVLAPGDPANSLLIKLIRHEGPANDPMPMPPKSKISDADIATVTEWVKAGAIVPAGQ